MSQLQRTFRNLKNRLSIVTDDQKNLHKELENILINFSNTCNPKSKDLETFVIKNKEKLHCIVNLQTGEDKTTLLHEFSSCAKIVSILLKEGADPDIQDRYGYTPLHIVTRYGYQDVIETFLNYNANPNIKDKYGNTPLCYAVESEEAGIVQSLLDKYETEVNIKNSKTGTPLIFDVINSNTTGGIILDYFLQSGKVDYSLRDGDGMTILHAAASKGHSDAVNVLLKKNIDPYDSNNKDGYTPLHSAILNDWMRSDTCSDNENRELGFDCVEDGTGDTHDNVITIVSLLIEKSARNISRTIKKRENFLEGIKDEKLCITIGDEIEKLKTRRKKVISYYVNTEDKHGHTAIFFAVEMGKKELVELLLSEGARVEIADENGFTPLHFAIHNENPEIFKTLLLHNSIEGEHAFTEKYNSEKMKRLLNVKDKEGNTLLHHAIKSGCSDKILNLIVKYVDINEKNKYGIAPIHIAAKYGKPSQIDFFIQNKANLNATCDILSKSMIEKIGKEKELSVNRYSNTRDNNVDCNSTIDIVDNTTYKKASAIAIAVDNSDSANTDMLLSAGVNTNIEDSRSWLPLHIAIKKASEENCTEEEREERIEIVRKLALISDVEFLMSEDTVQKDSLKKIKDFIGSTLVMTDSEKVQKEIKKSFSELMLQIKLNQEEINHILQDAVDANNYGKLPEAPISKENLLYNDAYDEIDHHVRKPTLYPDLSDYLSEGYSYTSHNSSIINSNTLDKWGGETSEVADIDTGAHNWYSTSKKDKLWNDLSDDQLEGTLKSVENQTNSYQTKIYDIQVKQDSIKKELEVEKEINFNLKLHQHIKLNKYIELIHKTNDLKSLYEIVDQALNMGIRINAQDMFGDMVLSRVNVLRKTNQDSEIITTIICKLISRGMPILENVRNFKEVCDKYHDNIEKAKRKFNNRLNELKEVAQRGLTKGELQNCEIDNTNFYLKYSEDSIIDVAKIINKTTLNSDIQLSYGLMKIGDNEVEIETNNGIRNYTDLSDNGNVVLTFSTSLGELKVVLKQRKDSIEVKVCDQKMFDQLVNSQEELGKNCRLGGLPVSEAINRGFFIRSSKPFSSYENTTPFNEMKNIHKKEGWCERISNEVKYSRERGI